MRPDLAHDIFLSKRDSAVSSRRQDIAAKDVVDVRLSLLTEENESITISGGETSVIDNRI